MKIIIVFATLAVGCALGTAPPARQLPDGPGKDVVERVCSACHGPEIVMGKALTKDGWTQVVEDMIQRGAQGSDDDFAQIVDYLAAHFPPQSESAKKVNVNKAPADELQSGLSLSAVQAKAIVDYRQQNGDFKSLADLKKVSSLDAAKIDAIKDRIVF
jgi:competence ComEA-like helix-hairpin-helix protein